MLLSSNNIDENLFEDLLKLLGENFACSSLVGEITILKEEHFNGKPVALMTVRDIIYLLNTKKEKYPACHAAYNLLQTAPVTVASNERSFSKLNLVKTKLRSTMMQDRLESLMLVSYERDLSVNIDIERDVKNWVNLKKRRVTFDT